MNRREKFSRRTRVILTIILVVLLTALIIYVVGLASQTVARLIFQKAITIVFNPLTCFRYAFLFDYSKYVWLAVGVIAVVLLGYSVTMSDRRGKMDATRRAENGNFDYSHKETYGSAKQMTTGEIKKFFKVLPATVEGMSKTNGDVVFGFLNEKKKKIVSMPDRDWSKGTDYNRNIAVCGPPGTGKTRAFVMNYIISKLSAGESLYVVDTKGEIYAKTCSFAKAQGYEVKILNLIETDCSDGWDVLGEVENDPEMAMELARIFPTEQVRSRRSATFTAMLLPENCRIRRAVRRAWRLTFVFCASICPTILPLRPSCNFKTQAMTFARRFCTAWRTACSSFRTNSSVRCWVPRISTSSNREHRSVFIISAFPTRPLLILSSRLCFSRSCSSN